MVYMRTSWVSFFYPCTLPLVDRHGAAGFVFAGFSALSGILPHCSQKWFADRRGAHLSAQDLGEWHETAVQHSGLILILRNGRAAQVDAGEKAARTRVREHFR